MPKALKSCHMCNKSPNLVTLDGGLLHLAGGRVHEHWWPSLLIGWKWELKKVEISILRLSKKQFCDCNMSIQSISVYPLTSSFNHGFVCAYHPAAPGSNLKHTIYAFFNLYWNCNEKRTKINKKRPGLAHLKKLVLLYIIYLLAWNATAYCINRTSVTTAWVRSN